MIWNIRCTPEITNPVCTPEAGLVLVCAPSHLRDDNARLLVISSYKVTETKRKVKIMSDSIIRKLMGVNKLPIRVGRAGWHHKSNCGQNQARVHSSDL